MQNLVCLFWEHLLGKSFSQSKYSTDYAQNKEIISVNIFLQSMHEQSGMLTCATSTTDLFSRGIQQHRLRKVKLSQNRLLSDQLYLHDVEVFYFKLRSPCRIAWRIISSGPPKHNKHNLHAFTMYFNIIISYLFTTAKSPVEKNMIYLVLPFWINEIYLPHFFSCSRHVIMHYLSPLALWYLCNMHIQLLFVIIWCLSKRSITENLLNMSCFCPFWHIFFLNCNLYYERIK